MRPDLGKTEQVMQEQEQEQEREREREQGAGSFTYKAGKAHGTWGEATDVHSPQRHASFSKYP